MSDNDSRGDGSGRAERERVDLYASRSQVGEPAGLGQLVEAAATSPALGTRTFVLSRRRRGR